MGPKKVVAKEVVDNWRVNIESAVLNDSIFAMKVIVIEPAGSDQDRLYLTKFEDFATQEKRFVTKIINRTETIFMVNQLGENKVKDENNRVFDEAQNFLRLKQDIPPEYLALIIKRLIMNIKEEYHFIQRQKLRVTEGLRRESNTMVDAAEVRGTVTAAAPPPTPPPPEAPKKGKDKKGVEVSPVIEDEGKKYNTQLRLRGEEWRDKVYVEDFPVDGPDLYIAITNFQDAKLPVALAKIGVPISAVVQVRIDPTTRKVPSCLSKTSKRCASQTEIQIEKSLHFWTDLQHQRVTEATAGDLKATAFIVFTPPYWSGTELSSEGEKIYDELCFLMYDIQDLSRQHAHYLDNVEIIDIPKSEEDVNFNEAYHQHIGDLPLECVTIYSVLDSVLQTVSDRVLLSQGVSTSLIPTVTTTVTTQLPTQRPTISDEKNKKPDTFVHNVFRALCQGDETRKSYRITYGEELENLKEPVVVNYGHIAKYSTFHLEKINLDNIIYSSLECMPLNLLWRNIIPPTESLEAKINFHVNTLLACFEREDVETPELERLLHILTCRKLYNNRSSIHKQFGNQSTIKEFQNAYLKRSLLAQPIMKSSSSVPSGTPSSMPSMSKIGPEQETLSTIIEEETEKRIRLIFDCPDISELVSAAEIANGAPISHAIDDYEYFEDFTGVAAFQILLDSYNKFNCLDYKYCEVTDCIVLMFYNSHDKDGLSREEWRCHITTPVCLQDFFDYVLEENYDWIQNEEEIYYRKMALVTSRSEHTTDLIDPKARQSCIAKHVVDMDMLIEGSLKYKEISQMAISSSSSEDYATTTIGTKSSSRKAASVVASIDGDSKSNKGKPKDKAGAKKSNIIPKVVKKPFIGYDLGDRRVEALGKDTTFFSKDGTKVISMYYLIIPLNFEWIILNITPGNGNNDFWVHNIIGDSVTPDQMEVCESFRIDSKGHVMINIKKVNYQIPIPTLLPQEEDTQETTSGTAHMPSLEVTLDEPVLMLTAFYHSLFITWPNGLVIESVHEENSRNISHIKQTYMSKVVPQLKEDARCISLQGEVIIFKSSGNIEILRPDASYINIAKYGKRKLRDVVVGDSGDKKAKDKGKGVKDKGKNVKANVKGSKNSSRTVNLDEEKTGHPPVYELFIEEFDVTHHSGIVQRFINSDIQFRETLLIQTATDFCLGEIFSRRMDGTNMLLNKDGVYTVTFMNGTRITTHFIIEDEEVYPEWSDYELAYFEIAESAIFEGEEEELPTASKQAMPQSCVESRSRGSVSGKADGEEHEEEQDSFKPRTDGYVSVQVVFTVEHPNFATVTSNVANKKVTVTSPNGTSVTVDIDNHYEITLDPVTTATFNGEDLNINYEACLECHSLTTCEVKLRKEHVEPSSTQAAPTLAQPWVKMKDSFCNKIVVNYEGEISLCEEVCSQEMFKTEEAAEETADKRQSTGDTKSEASLTGKCREMYTAKKYKYFVMKRELSCSALVHRALVDVYQQQCRWQPWCSIESYNSFGDHRRLISMLSPVHLNESEKWLMDSKLAGKPKYLTYQDLRKDTGKGFYHWMRPYGGFIPHPMKVENVLPTRPPRAFIFRTLEQQWTADKRNDLKGAKELLSAILKYRRIMESDTESELERPITDRRTNRQKGIYKNVQALGRRIYEDLRKRLQNSLEMTAKADITTEPEPSSVETESMLGEHEMEEAHVEDAVEGERLRHLHELDATVEISDSRARYWRRRAEELKEEEFYKCLLRDGTVPPYFKNLLGGAIWAEVNETAGDAVARAARRKMKCVCGEEVAPSEDPNVFNLS